MCDLTKLGVAANICSFANRSGLIVPCVIHRLDNVEQWPITRSAERRGEREHPGVDDVATSRAALS
jgi:hypothetical protein